MQREEVLLRRLAKDVLDIYFSGPSEKEMYRRVNAAVSRYLDGCDVVPLYQESEINEIYGKGVRK